MSGELKINMINTIESNRMNYSYEVFSELAVVFATKMDPTYCARFFERFMAKFINDMKYLDDSTLYKLLWSFVKAGRF